MNKWLKMRSENDRLVAELKITSIVDYKNCLRLDAESIQSIGRSRRRSIVRLETPCTAALIGRGKKPRLKEEYHITFFCLNGVIAV